MEDNIELAELKNKKTNKVGLYWRTGFGMFAHHHPGIMSLSGNQLSFRTAHRQLFDADTSRLSVTFTMFGTIKVIVDGKKYSFIPGGYAGVAAEPFSRDQVKELAEASAEIDEGEGFTAGIGAYKAANAAVAIVGRTKGVVMMYKSQYKSFNMSLGWATYLESKGLNVSFKARGFAKSQIVLISTIVPALVALGIGIFLLIAKFS